jgi:hypothetical protein
MCCCCCCFFFFFFFFFFFCNYCFRRDSHFVRRTSSTTLRLTGTPSRGLRTCSDLCSRAIPNSPEPLSRWSIRQS